MANFRRFLVPSLEDDTVVQATENKESIIDTAAVVDTILDPAVANPAPAAEPTPEPAATEATPEAAPAPEEAPAATPAPAADAPAEDAAADVNTPASTPEEPAATEAAPVEAATSEEVPSADVVTPVEPVDQPTAEPVVETPADTAPVAPAVEAPAADAATGATEDTTTAAETAADATQAPADTGESANAPESTEVGEGVVPAEPVVEPAATEVAAEVTETPVEAAPAEPVVMPEAEPAVEPEVVVVPEAEVAPAEEAVAEVVPEVTEPSDDEVALEELEAELSAGEEARQDAELLQSLTTDLQADDDVENQLAAVLESLEVLAENTANLIENDQCTEQTAQLIEDAASTSLQQVGVELQFPAMESYGSDVKIRHQLVLENLDNYADRIRQMLDVNVSQRIKQLGQTFAIYEAQVSKFQQGIGLLREQYKKQKGQWEMKDHEGSLASVGRFFNVNDGNIMGVLSEDLKISDYVLTQYPDQILKNFEEIIRILSGAKYRDSNEFVAFLKKFSGIKTQADIFKMKDNTKIHALLGNAAIIHTVGALPKTLSYGETSFPELAEAAKYNAFEEYNAEFVKAILKATNPLIAIGSLVIGIPSAVVNVVSASKVTLSTDEIGKLIDTADKYADNCLAWSKTISRIIGIYQKLDSAMDRFSSIGSDIGGITLGNRYRVWRLLGQVKTIVRNQMKYVDTPTAMESFRSFMGAKYCYYLAKRFVGTAK